MILFRHAIFLAFLAGGPWATAVPLIQVEGNGVVIADGDNFPSLADHTDFGPVGVGTEAAIRVFTIRNVGASPLLVYNVQVIGGSAGAFSVPVQPGQVIPGGSSTQFAAWFNPGVQGPLTTTIRINNNASSDLRHEFRIRGTGTEPSPEINVQGNNMNIAAGDPLPSPDDHTDFGPANFDDAGRITRTFTIQNLGDATLTIDSVQRIGGNRDDFSIKKQPAGTVFAGGDTTLRVEFEPTTTGLRRTTIRIVNNDISEANFDFVVQGTGASFAPEINLVGNGMNIAAGDEEPSHHDHTNFGSVALGNGTINRTFTIENLGSSNLEISSVQVVGGEASDFSIPDPPSSLILAGNTTTFDVVFKPGGEGPRSTTLRIESNDSDEDPYDVTILGFGGSFKLVRIERDGDDAIVHFDASPDTTISTYFYTIQHNPGLEPTGWNSVGALNVSGGDGAQQYRHVDGWVGPAGHWRIIENAIQ